MAIKYYLQVTDIPGDATAADYRNWIDTLSYSWGGDSDTTFASAAARVDHRPLLVTTNSGKHTTRMLEKFHTRGRIRTAILAGADNRTEIIRVTLSDVYIGQWDMAGSSSADAPAESWSLFYGSAVVALGNLDENWTTGLR